MRAGWDDGFLRELGLEELLLNYFSKFIDSFERYSKNSTKVVNTLLASSAYGETCYVRKLGLKIASQEMVNWAFGS